MDDQKPNRSVSIDVVVGVVGAGLMILGPLMNAGTLLIAGSILVVGALIAHAIRTNPPLLIKLPLDQLLSSLRAVRTFRWHFSLRTLLIVMTLVAIVLGGIAISMHR